MQKELLIGKIGNDKVQLEIEIKDKPITSGAVTMALTPVLGSTYKTLSISGSIGNHSYGQIYDSINPSEFDELYIDTDQLIHLLAIWKTCHLNDLNAGSLLQTEYTNFYRDQIKPANQGWDYNECCSMLKQHHLLIDHETNPELTVGYKYGTLWLINYLPDSVIEFIANLQSTPADKLRSNTLDYILEHNFKWDIRLADSNPNMQSDQEMDHWKVTLIDDNGDRMDTYFSTGFGHRLIGKNRFPTNGNLSVLIGKWMRKTIASFGIALDSHPRNQITKLGFQIPLAAHWNSPHQPFNGIPVPPMPDQVIECIISDALSIEDYGDWHDWASDMGFDTNDRLERRSAQRTYFNTQEQSEKAQMFFRSHWSELIDRSY